MFVKLSVLPALLVLGLASHSAAAPSGCFPCAQGIDNVSTDHTNAAVDATATVSPRVVYNPHITSPRAGTVWHVGSEVTVTWDTSDMPARVTNPKGRLVLGYLQSASTTDEHLDFSHPLADGFDIGTGAVTVTVPDVEHGSDYIVVLFGDSGNRSPTFTITN